MNHKMCVLLCFAMLAIAFAASAADDQLRHDPNFDPRIALAEDAMSVIKLREEMLNKTLDEIFTILDTSLDKVGKSFEGDQIAVSGMMVISKNLEKTAEQIIAIRKDYDTNVLALRKASENAPPVYQQAGQVFRDYAAEEEYDAIKSDYLVLAEAWEYRAQILAVRSRAIVPDKEIGEILHYIERTAIFLKRFQEHLVVFREKSSEIELENFKSRLGSYVHYYERLRGYLNDYRNRLREESKSLKEGEDSKSAIPPEKQNERPSVAVRTVQYSRIESETPSASDYSKASAAPLPTRSPDMPAHPTSFQRTSLPTEVGYPPYEYNARPSVAVRTIQPSIRENDRSSTSAFSGPSASPLSKRTPSVLVHPTNYQRTLPINEGFPSPLVRNAKPPFVRGPMFVVVRLPGRYPRFAIYEVPAFPHP